MNDSRILYRILGEDLQILEVALAPGQTIKSEVGAMLYMDEAIYMQTSVAGGIVQAVKRRISGETVFMPGFTCTGDEHAVVALAAPHPGKIVDIRLSEYGGSLLCQKGAFLAASSDVSVEIAFVKRLGAGLFGKEGFILQKLRSEDGLAFIHAGGTVVERDLEKTEVLRVDSGCLVAFAPTVGYSVEFIRGLRNAFFSGEGLFLIRLTGPGKVFLQSLPFRSLADRILDASGLNKAK